jgi:hypothetical protein
VKCIVDRTDPIDQIRRAGRIVAAVGPIFRASCTGPVSSMRTGEQLAAVTPGPAMEASWKPHPPRDDLQKICSLILRPALTGET